MHSKALDLLKEYVVPLYRSGPMFLPSIRLSTLEDDMEDKLDPSIQYLQKLGPEYIDEVFRYARWIFDTDKDMAFQVSPQIIPSLCFSRQMCTDFHVGLCRTA